MSPCEFAFTTIESLEAHLAVCHPNLEVERWPDGHIAVYRDDPRVEDITGETT